MGEWKAEGGGEKILSRIPAVRLLGPKMRLSENNGFDDGRSGCGGWGWGGGGGLVPG